MKLKLFNECQNKCNPNLNRLAKSAVSTADALNAIKQIKSDSIIIAGGESLLRPDIELIFKASERIKNKQIYTTARNINTALLKKYGFSAIVPFFGIKKETHEAITNVDGSFDEALIGILNLFRHGIKVTVEYVVTKQNASELNAMLDFFKARGVREFSLHLPEDLVSVFPTIKSAWEHDIDLKIRFENHKRKLSILLNEMFTGPIVTQFEITNTCNHQCVFCYHHSPHLLDKDDIFFKTHKFDKELVKRSPEWHSKRVDYKELMANVRLASESGCNYIQLGGGGEPTTHPHLMQMLKYIKEMGLQVQVFTNFTLLTKAKLRHFVEWGVDVLEVNMSADNAETYAKIHNRDDFQQVVSNMDYLKIFKKKKVKPEIRIMNPICSLNYKEIPGMVEFAHMHGASAVYFGHLQTTPQTKYLLLRPNQVKLVNKLVARALKMAKSYSIKNNFDNYLYVLNYKGTLEGSHTKKIYNKVGCLIPFYETQIHLDGTVAPCCLHPPIFEVKGRNFIQLWNAPEYKAFRAKVLNLYTMKKKPFLCRGCRMCVYQDDIQKFYNELGELTRWLGK